MSEDIFLIDGAKYKLWQPKDEINEFEPMVLEHIQDIFGKNALYFGKKKIKTTSGVGSRPDGFVITLDGEPTCYVLEIEVSDHSPYEHGINQLSRIEDAIDNPYSHKEIVDSIYDNIKGTQKEILIRKKTNKDIYKFLSDIITTERTKTVIIIERLTEKWKVPFKKRATEIIEFKTFARVDGFNNYINPKEVHTHLFKPIIQTIKEKPKEEITDVLSEITSARPADFNTIICPAREEGFRRVFIGEDRWYEIRISKSKIPKIKYIAMYEVAPVSAIRWTASVREIKPYKDTGKYQLLLFDKKQINPIRLTPEEGKKHLAPHGSWYSTMEKIRTAKKISDTF